jgi:4-hydroxybenzoate polyprenyltransferase
VTKNLGHYWQLMRFDKPIGIFVILWPTYWALWLSTPERYPSLRLFLIFTAGTVIMRAAGCIINDLADQRFDGHVERTKNRPLITGAVTQKQATTLFFILIGIALGLVLMLPPLCFFLSIIAVALTLTYPLMKRYIHLPQGILGLALAWGIPMAYAATNNQLPLTAILLFIATAFWVIAYDTEYALVDREDDLQIGVKSSAILFGHYAQMAIIVCQLLFLSGIVLIGLSQHLAWPFYLSILITGQFFFQQNRLLNTKNSANYFTAFLNNHWVGLTIFIGIAMAKLIA